MSPCWEQDQCELFLPQFQLATKDNGSFSPYVQVGSINIGPEIIKYGNKELILALHINGTCSSFVLNGE